MVKKLILSCLLTGITVTALATQIIPIRNNGEAKVKIAGSDYTRIFVKGDRINDVKGVSGQYNIKINHVTGQVFISPTDQYKNKPFNIFLTTENGSTYQLLLLPMPIPADSVELDPPLIKSPKAKNWEESTAYVNALTELVKDMYNNNSPDGYSVSSVSESYQWLGKIAKVKLVKIYSGDHLRGNIYVIKNTINKPIKLTEQQLYRSGARLVALQDEVIPPYGTTKLFMVTNNE